MKNRVLSELAGILLTGGIYLYAGNGYAEVKRDGQDIRTINLPRVGKVNLDAKIIPQGHFSWAEATKYGTRVPKDERVVENIVKTAGTMEEIRKYLGGRAITITSWYRDPETNRKVGGAEKSMHMQGLAVDFSVSGLEPREVYKKMDEYWGSKGGLGKYNSWTHVDGRGKPARWSANK